MAQEADERGVRTSTISDALRRQKSLSGRTRSKANRGSIGHAR